MTVWVRAIRSLARCCCAGVSRGSSGEMYGSPPPSWAWSIAIVVVVVVVGGRFVQVQDRLRATSAETARIGAMRRAPRFMVTIVRGGAADVKTPFADRRGQCAPQHRVS